MTMSALSRMTPRRRKPAIAIAAAAALVAGAAIATSTLNAQAATTPLSQGQTAIASSEEATAYSASAAVDGDASTRWSSAFSDPQWLQVDLGSTATITKVVLTWEAAYATAFQIQTSPDASTWTSVYSTTAGTGGTQTLSVSGTGRYVRMYGTARATAYGYSLWEFQVYGSSSTSTSTAAPASGEPVTGGGDLGDNVIVFDPSMSTADGPEHPGHRLRHPGDPTSSAPSATR